MNLIANDSVYLFSILDLFCLLLHSRRTKTIEVWQPVERSDPMSLTQLSLWGSCRVKLFTCNRWIWYVWQVSGYTIPKYWSYIQKVGIKINAVIANFNVRFCLGWSEMLLAVDWTTGVRLPGSNVSPLHKTIWRTTTSLPFPSLQWIHSSVIQVAYLLKPRISTRAPSEKLVT